jgi:hypothetical protein
LESSFEAPTTANVGAVKKAFSRLAMSTKVLDVLSIVMEGIDWLAMKMNLEREKKR